MNILAIETSCDETAVSVLECEGGFDAPRVSVLGTGLYSQASKHAEFGGVYPNLAKREHQQNLIPLLQKALEESNFANSKSEYRNPKEIPNSKLETIQKILEREQELLKQFLEYTPTIEKPPFDAIAVTQGPGLEPALWAGLNFTKALSLVWQVPLVPVNHMEGHVLSVLGNGEGFSIHNFQFPMVALLVSGGHTELVLVKDWLEYELIGQTRDDAVGEAFDKVARLLGLPYPGGPEISKLADGARKTSNKQPVTSYQLPRPMINSNDYDFSFAGLKTAVLYLVKKLGTLTDEMKQDIAREFEDAAVEVLVEKTRRALAEYGAKTLIVAGGVVANTHLRMQINQMITRNFPDVSLLMPTHELSTDNAVMIGIAGYLRFIKNPSAYLPYAPEQELKAQGTLRLA